LGYQHPTWADSLSLLTYQGQPSSAGVNHLVAGVAGKQVFVLPYWQPLEEAHHLLDAAHAGALDGLPGLAEHAEGDVLGVDVEPDVEQRNLPKSECA
jgi:hypothetical protein